MKHWLTGLRLFVLVCSNLWHRKSCANLLIAIVTWVFSTGACGSCKEGGGRFA